MQCRIQLFIGRFVQWTHDCFHRGDEPWRAKPPLPAGLRSELHGSDAITTQPYLRKAAQLMTSRSCGEGWLLQPKIMDMPDLEYRSAALLCLSCTSQWLPRSFACASKLQKAIWRPLSDVQQLLASSECQVYCETNRLDFRLIALSCSPAPLIIHLQSYRHSMCSSFLCLQPAVIWQQFLMCMAMHAQGVPHRWRSSHWDSKGHSGCVHTSGSG